MTAATITAASSKIAAITLSHINLEKIELLDHGQNNWGTWSAKIHNYLLLKHGGGHLLSVITHPNNVLDPAGVTTWDLNNLCIVVALSTRSCTEDQNFLLPFTDAHATWTALKSHHEQVGPIAQILLIQQAFALRYRCSERFALTSTQLTDLTRHIYAIWIPKEEDFLTILMLNAMSEDLPHVRNHVTDTIVISTPSAPYGPTNIHTCLELEQQLIDNDKGKGSGDVAMITSNKGKSSHGRPSCPDCGQTTHQLLQHVWGLVALH
jgi:hypothetical protein